MPGVGASDSVTRPSAAPTRPTPYGVSGAFTSRISAIQSDPRYLGIFERWNYGKPIIDAAHDLNATYSNTECEVAAFVANRAWLVAGTNMTTALVTYAAGGGITTTTAGADNDQAYIIPNNAAEVLGQVGETTWDFDREPYFACNLVTGASVADMSGFWGFKIDLDVGVNDADLLGFSFVAGTDTTLALACRKNSSDVFAENTYSTAQNQVYNTGVTLEASTLYRLECWIDPDGFPSWAINDLVFETRQGQLNSILSAPTTAPTRGGTSSVVPVCFLHANAAAAKAITYRNMGVFQKYE